MGARFYDVMGVMGIAILGSLYIYHKLIKTLRKRFSIQYKERIESSFFFNDKRQNSKRQMENRFLKILKKRKIVEY